MPISDTVALMQQVLTKNKLSFMGKNFLQVHGTTMGSRMTPSLVCVFMSQLGITLCRPCGYVWWRYIDDIFFIFFIWTSDESSLSFINHINSFHRTIKFTSKYSNKDTHFLDVKVLKTDDGLITDLFDNPIDKQIYISIQPAVFPDTAKPA